MHYVKVFCCKLNGREPLSTPPCLPESGSACAFISLVGRYTVTLPQGCHPVGHFSRLSIGTLILRHNNSSRATELIPHLILPKEKATLFANVFDGKQSTEKLDMPRAALFS